MTTPSHENESKEATPVASTNGTNPSHAQLRVENSMTSKLQYAIDNNGRYAPTLNALALGYAAGAGVKEQEAREDIKAVFQDRMGMSLKDYLTQHREENGLPVDRSSENER